MKILIIEDEHHSAERLQSMITKIDSSIEVLDILNSVSQSKKWFQKNHQVDLILLDIYLSDGTCFDIFDEIEVLTPIIFTTAYDNYSLKAFRLNSIDYLLKPIAPNDLEKAIEKFKKVSGTSFISLDILESLKNELLTRREKRFLSRMNSQLHYIKSSDIAYLLHNDGLWAINWSGEKLPLDMSLEQIEKQLDPANFFRINRNMMVNINSIQKINTYFNGRLLLELQPSHNIDTIVSRERCQRFKLWMEGE